ncbi:hypothetical protein A3A93_05420 [Candidatus Roizmanbacteria bacterium RIFCSPLOWO2_01_FULL_38_12]|uniref:PIN domain-containing protein n=1 Tax=Candidatus Roizmanbacteria bacterium RIFCSPLOWO2_01_FULL_38_12 TaxID=1802061 RepID=A0A1F7IZ22_9BACT|nr:MAG: hypothetical protein A2861_03635 [Candidatus Roizmanbacteria bacterium RIFCSPHIGHO2_01_FULL_38_15]OGK35660.1 MAG: hypothetical protein A3F59_01850 [Candidatus Roizmanbacteria bacterium RIFCSPHIGHO2_12_FULL_38_13]OGK48626.1 MAG: hypothetical protein A3A93_05420 [Candidatus Roizmanbacteria bacterium RIFCSPLOWO2_01_FULL_38_12]
MKTYIIDTNIILQFLLADIPIQYEKVKQIFLKAKNEKVQLFVPQIVIFEINFGLTKFYQLEKSTIIKKIESLLSTKYLQIESTDVFKRALNYYKDSSSLSLVDCFLLAKAESEDAELFTFDEKLKKTET